MKSFHEMVKNADPHSQGNYPSKLGPDRLTTCSGFKYHGATEGNSLAPGVNPELLFQWYEIFANKKLLGKLKIKKGEGKSVRRTGAMEPVVFEKKHSSSWGGMFWDKIKTARPFLPKFQVGSAFQGNEHADRWIVMTGCMRFFFFFCKKEHKKCYGPGRLFLT